MRLILSVFIILFALPSFSQTFPPAGPGAGPGSWYNRNEADATFWRKDEVIRLKSGITAPPTCRPGDLFFDTNADSDGAIMLCISTNTWKEIGGSIAAGGGDVTFQGADATFQGGVVTW